MSILARSTIRSAAVARSVGKTQARGVHFENVVGKVRKHPCGFRIGLSLIYEELTVFFPPLCFWRSLHLYRNDPARIDVQQTIPTSVNNRPFLAIKIAAFTVAGFGTPFAIAAWHL
jgi:hypothetical protein